MEKKLALKVTLISLGSNNNKALRNGQEEQEQLLAIMKEVVQLMQILMADFII